MGSDRKLSDCKVPEVGRKRLDRLYSNLNRKEFVHPDPLEFLYEYEDVRDRELVGLISSSLAYGRVRQILKSVADILRRMGSPHKFLRCSTEKSLFSAFSDFKHRFTTGREVATMLAGAKQVLDRHDSLYACFASHMNKSDSTVLPALSGFVNELYPAAVNGRSSLIPLPTRGSSCKRLNLFLRWMVRRDAVDPGGWDSIDPAKLVIPLDTHMHRIGRALHLTKRKQADMHTAIEITEAFRSIIPEDPVRYDFALTRLGIRDDMKIDDFVVNCGGLGEV